jgi:hypothetical protein
MRPGLLQQPAATGDDDLDVQKLDTKAGMHPPKAIFDPEATYSAEARQKLINGKCMISLVVGADGLPHKIQAVRCSDPSLMQNSLASVARYKFRPATTAAGVPVAVAVTVEVDYRIDGGKNIPDPIRWGFASPPGMLSKDADSGGVYPLTKLESPPVLTKFNDKGYATTAFALVGSSPCEILVTIDAKGKPAAANVVHCEHEVLAPLALNSLLASKFSPATLNGKAVPVRAMVHLEYGEFPAQPTK